MDFEEVYQTTEEPDHHQDKAEEGETGGERWEFQIWTLVLGLVFGMVANFLSRIFAVGRGAQKIAAEASDPLAASSFKFSTDNKMVLLVRTDLAMTKGKVAAQAAHAAVGCYKKAVVEAPSFLKQWEVFGQAKITLKVDSEQTIKEIGRKAKEMGLVYSFVRDAGRTQVENGCVTVLGIGPAPSKLVDEITGHLKLY